MPKWTSAAFVLRTNGTSSSSDSARWFINILAFAEATGCFSPKVGRTNLNWTSLIITSDQGNIEVMNQKQNTYSAQDPHYFGGAIQEEVDLLGNDFSLTDIGTLIKMFLQRHRTP